MALLLKGNAVFLHVPKTGGTWIEVVLRKLDLVVRPIGREHITYERLFWHNRFERDSKVLRNLARNALGMTRRIDPDCYKFCFVRQPLDWYVSWWRFMHTREWRGRQWGGQKADPYQWNQMAMMDELFDPDFNAFVHNMNRRRPGYATELYGWYARPGISFVGKQENLIGDLAKVLERLGVKVTEEQLREMPRANESPEDIRKPEWDPALKRETLRLEYAGYVRYGYPVEEPAQDNRI